MNYRLLVKAYIDYYRWSKEKYGTNTLNHQAGLHMLRPLMELAKHQFLPDGNKKCLSCGYGRPYGWHRKE